MQLHFSACWWQTDQLEDKYTHTLQNVRYSWISGAAAWPMKITAVWQSLKWLANMALIWRSYQTIATQCAAKSLISDIRRRQQCKHCSELLSWGCSYTDLSATYEPVQYVVSIGDPIAFAVASLYRETVPKLHKHGEMCFISEFEHGFQLLGDRVTCSNHVQIRVWNARYFSGISCTVDFPTFICLTA